MYDILDGMTEDEWIRKHNQESEVRQFVRENPNKTIRDMLDACCLKAEINDINFEENYIRIRFGEDGIMRLKFNFVNVNEDNVERLIDGILDNECSLIGGI